MKTSRFLRNISWLSVALACAAGTLLADTYGQYGNFYYTDTGTAVTITGYDVEPQGDLVIPPAINGNPVTGIGNNAFRTCGYLTSVTFPSSVIDIGDHAFEYCIRLASVTMPESVKRIGAGAFLYCGALTGVAFPSSVTSIGSAAFFGSGLTSLTIPGGVDSIGVGAFGNCSGLAAISVNPNTRFYSRDGALYEVEFYNTQRYDFLLQYPAGKAGTYSIPSSVSGIIEGAFNGCKWLTAVEIPVGATIGQGAFMDCSGLMVVSIPDGTPFINPNVFNGCTSLTGVTIPSSVTSIGFAAFSGSGLTSVTIPASVTYIGGYAFAGCTGLKDVAIPSSVTDIESYAFSKSGLTSVVIPASVTSIGYSVFADCPNLTSVTISAGVTSIGSDEFSGSGLTSVTIPASVTSIGDSAFQYCTSLTSAEFLGNAPEMGGWVFESAAAGFIVKFHAGATGFTTPTWLGYPSGSLTQNIWLSGNLTFGNVKVGSAANATMTISNTGNAPLTVIGISYPSGFTGNWASGSIAAGSSQNVTVTFSPSAAQPYGGTITVNSDATSGTNTIAAIGQGTQTALEAWQAANFTAGEISAGSAAPATDFEHDGMGNLLEYAFAKNPKVADLTGIAPNVSANKMQISFRCDASCTDITYIVQASSNLSTWTEIARSAGGAKTVDFTGSGCEISDTGSGVRTVTVTEKDAFAGKRFLRVKVTSP